MPLPPADYDKRMNGKTDAAPPRRIDDDPRDDYASVRRAYYSTNGNGNGNGHGNGASRSTVAWISAAGSVLGVVVAIVAMMQLFVAPLTTRFEDSVKNSTEWRQRQNEQFNELTRRLERESSAITERVRELERGRTGGR